MEWKIIDIKDVKMEKYIFENTMIENDEKCMKI